MQGRLALGGLTGGHAELHEHHGFAVLAVQGAEVGHTLPGLGFPVGIAAVLPIGRVEREADHVIPGRIGLHQVVEPGQRGNVPAVVQVQDDRSLGIDGLDGIGTGVEILYEMIDRRAAYLAGNRSRGVLQVALRPQVHKHAGAYLIAHLDPGHIDLVVFQGLEYAAGMGADGGCHFRGVVALPGRRDDLLAGIRPAVTVVEIDQDLHAQRLGTLALDQYVGDIVVTGGRVDPDAVTHAVAADALHQGRALHFGAGRRVELVAFGFHFGDPAEVGALGEDGHGRRFTTPAVLAPASAGRICVAVRVDVPVAGRRAAGDGRYQDQDVLEIHTIRR